jgi:DNA-binding NtrC family response regulator
MQIEPEAIALLLNYSWPGNVRQLENVIQRAIILASDATVRARDIVLNAQEEDCADLVNLVDIGDYNPSCSFERHIRDYKVKLAIAAVRQHNGNKTLAARSLGITRAYVHRLIRLADSDPFLEEDIPLVTAAGAQNA